LNGFVGEFLILLGAFQTHRVAAIVATSGVLLGAVYLLWMYQRVMFGPLQNPANRTLQDLSPREVLVFVPILVMLFVMGLYPKPFLSRMEPSVQAYLARMNQKMAANVQPSAISYQQSAVGQETELAAVEGEGR
jgi:NADH-quinone oxidoreductase subunit M